MLRTIRSGQRWLTGALVIGIGGVMVFFLGLGGPLQGGSANSALITVGPYTFTVRDFQVARNEREEMLRERLGDNYDRRAMSETLNNLTTQALIERSLLAVEAAETGLSVSKGEIERSVRAGFSDGDGHFDKEQFTSWVEYNYGNERNFVREQRMRLLAGKMLGVMSGSARVSDAEIRQALDQRLQEVRIAFVVFEANKAPEGFEVSQEDIAALLETRETEARNLYEERDAEYNLPEQVRARHILFRLDPEADETAEKEAREKAESALARLGDGEEFRELASELTEDVGSQESGGDLGFFQRGRMVKAFEDVAFELAVGETSGLVRSDFGFHIIRSEERKEAAFRPFEDLREELAAELIRLDAAGSAARAGAESLSAAISSGKDLETAAAEADLDLIRSGLLKRRPDGFVPRLGAAQELMATAFGMEPGESSPQIFEVGARLALFQLLEKVEPDPAELDRLAEGERDAMLSAKRNALISDWLEWRRQALEEDDEFNIDIAAIKSFR